MPYHKICQVLELPLSSVRRWRGRARLHHPIIGVPGPRKVQPLDLTALQAEVRDLGHRQHRTFGTPVMYRKYQWQISRRDLQAMVNSVRREMYQKKRAELTCINWLVPNLAWAMDDTPFGRDENRHVQYLHTMQDMATTYKFEVLAGPSVPTGKAIAEHLRATCDQNGFPLFVKEDNGPNQRDKEVEETMADLCILPLPSPREYPQYNGAEEHGNGEIKRQMREQLFPDTACPSLLLQSNANDAVHHWNHASRDKLHGQIACYMYHGRVKYSPFNRKERRSIYEWLVDKQNDILSIVGVPGGPGDKWIREAAWRKAALMWLWINKQIEINLNDKVLPYLNWKCAH